MRTIRLAEPPSAVGTDLRAALFALGRDESACGGVALVGCLPHGAPSPVDAVVVTPHATFVVVGVDLPEPALSLHAPLQAAWTSDGWPLTGPEGLANPALPVLRSAAQARRVIGGATGDDRVHTVVAVGPYVEHVEVPAAEADTGVTVLHPTPGTMLAALRGRAAGRPDCDTATAERLLRTLAPDSTLPESGDLHGLLTREGFPAAQPGAIRPDTPTAGAPGSRGPSLADAATTLIPRVPTTAATRGRGSSARPAGRYRLGAYGLGSLAFVALVVVLVITAGSTEHGTATSSRVGDAGVTVQGRDFHLRTHETSPNCATHAFGDVQATLREHPCVSLARRAFTTDVGGRRAAVSVADLTFDDPVATRAFTTTLDVPGSGGIEDLAGDGEHAEDAPASFAGAAYASHSDGAHARVTAVVWFDGPSRSSDPALGRVARRALRLPAAR